MAKTEQKRLLILTSSFPRWPGDFAGCFVEEFAQSLSRDYQITILAPASINAPEIELRGNLKIHRFNYFWPRKQQLLDAGVDLQPLLEQSLLARLQVPFFLLKFFFHTFLLARKNDLICSHWMLPAGLVGSIVTRLLNKPHFVIEHSGAIHLLRKLNRVKIGALLARFITSSSTRIVTVTEYLRDHLVTLAPTAINKIDVVPMGINTAVFADHKREIDQPSKFQILFLGRLTAVKGVRTLIDAVADGIDCQLIIAGDGDDRAKLEQYADSRGIKALFTGVVTGSDKIALLKNCDIVVIPSIELTDGRSEGLPVVCLEAFAARRAVIASAVGGLQSLIKSGDTGLLVDPGDIQQLRSAILQLQNSPKLRDEMGERAAHLVAQYDWSRLAARFRAILNTGILSEVYDKSRINRITANLEE